MNDPTPEQVQAARNFCYAHHCEGQRTRGDGTITTALAALLAAREAALRADLSLACERAEKYRTERDALASQNGALREAPRGGRRVGRADNRR